jgi:hypothetical protein
MKTLKTQFRLNNLPYTLLKRNDKVALYGIGGEFTDDIIHYEVDIIYIRHDQYGEREAIATNDTFGRDRSRCFNNKEKALNYYDELTTELEKERNLSQEVSKVIAEVEENAEVVS